MARKLRVFLLLLLFSFNSNAFNWRECSRSMKTTGGNIFSASTVATGSSSSYVSSTGRCSALGMNREERAQLFYAINYDKVLEDIARGQGEFYLSLATLWGCDQQNALKKVHPLRGSYSNLLNLSEERQYEFIKERMSCKNDKET